MLGSMLPTAMDLSRPATLLPALAEAKLGSLASARRMASSRVMTSGWGEAAPAVCGVLFATWEKTSGERPAARSRRAHKWAQTAEINRPENGHAESGKA